MPSIVLRDLLGKGYFPRELPPPFQTKEFADYVALGVPSSFSTAKKAGKFSIHNLARAGTLRRTLGIPNPIHQFRLSKAIVDNWAAIDACFDKTTLSLSRPTLDITGKRAIDRETRLSERPKKRAKERATSNYVLKADISRFYGSIYTHSIPWAIHTKPVAKLNYSTALFGNLLDKLVRDGQDQQTIGIPIGPDTSLVIAELILSAVDESLTKKAEVNAFRYVDDYEFSAQSQGDSENVLNELQERLNEYELVLNSEKTSIASLPQELEARWAEELRVLPIGKIRQKNNLTRYFDHVFSFVRNYPSEHVVHYALQRVRSLNLQKDNWQLFEDLLLQSIMIQPGAIRFAIPILGEYQQYGYKITKTKIKKMIHAMIDLHASKGHASEVAWSLWAAILFNIKIRNPVAKKLELMDDSVVSLLALDARSMGLISSSVPFTQWADCMTTAHLYERQWLIAYEANLQGWLPSKGSPDNVAADVNFKQLKSNHVSFYDTNAVVELRKKKVKPLTWGSISPVVPEY